MFQCSSEIIIFPYKVVDKYTSVLTISSSSSLLSPRTPWVKAPYHTDTHILGTALKDLFCRDLIMNVEIFQLTDFRRSDKIPWLDIFTFAQARYCRKTRNKSHWNVQYFFLVHFQFFCSGLKFLSPHQFMVTVCLQCKIMWVSLVFRKDFIFPTNSFFLFFSWSLCQLNYVYVHVFVHPCLSFYRFCLMITVFQLAIYISLKCAERKVFINKHGKVCGQNNWSEIKDSFYKIKHRS